MLCKSRSFGRLVDVEVLFKEVDYDFENACPIYDEGQPIEAYVNWSVTYFPHHHGVPISTVRGFHRQLGLAIAYCEKVKVEIARRKHKVKEAT